MSRLPYLKILEPTFGERLMSVGGHYRADVSVAKNSRSPAESKDSSCKR